MPQQLCLEGHDFHDEYMDHPDEPGDDDSGAVKTGDPMRYRHCKTPAPPVTHRFFENAVHTALKTLHILRFTFKIWVRKRGGISGAIFA